MGDDEAIERPAGASLTDNISRIPQLVDKEHVLEMIDIQEVTIQRLECANKSLLNCTAMAQNKLASTTRLYKKTAKQIAESKKDLDVIYKKIIEMKAKIRAERPDLCSAKEFSNTQEESGDQGAQESAPTI